MQKLVDGFTLLEPRQRAVLPVDRGGVGQGAAEALVTDLQRPVAELQPLVENFPEEVKVAVGGKTYVGEIDGDYALVNIRILLSA